MVAGGGVHLILAADHTRAFARVRPLNSIAVRRGCIMLRARDRLKEAEFFLQRLDGAAGTEPDSRYFFAALVSATRSVTLVLQSYLRPRFEDRFDAWWTVAASQIRPSPLDFATLRDTRNVLQKQGNRLPLVTVVETYDTGPVVWLSATFDPSRGVEGLEQAEVAPRAAAASAPSTVFSEALAAAIAGTSSPATSSRTYTLPKAMDSVSFDTLVASFRAHLRDLDALLAEAEQRFPIESIWHRP